MVLNETIIDYISSSAQAQSRAIIDLIKIQPQDLAEIKNLFCNLKKSKELSPLLVNNDCFEELEDFLRVSISNIKQEIVQELSMNFAQLSWHALRQESISSLFFTYQWYTNFIKELSEYLSDSFRFNVLKIDEIEAVIQEIEASLTIYTLKIGLLSREEFIDLRNCLDKICSVASFESENLRMIEEQSKIKIIAYLQRIFEKTNAYFAENNDQDFIDFAKYLFNITREFEDIIRTDFNRQLSLNLIQSFSQYYSTIYSIIISSYSERLEPFTTEKFRSSLCRIRCIDYLMNDTLATFNVTVQFRETKDKIQQLIIVRWKELIHEINDHYERHKPPNLQGIFLPFIIIYYVINHFSNYNLDSFFDLLRCSGFLNHSSFVIYAEVRSRVDRFISERKSHLKKEIEFFFNNHNLPLDLGRKYEEIKEILKEIASISQMWCMPYSGHTVLDFFEEISEYFQILMRILLEKKTQVSLAEYTKVEEICYCIVLLSCLDENIKSSGLSLERDISVVSDRLFQVLIKLNNQAVKLASIFSETINIININDAILNQILSLFQFTEIIQKYESSFKLRNSCFIPQIDFIQVL